MGTKLYQFEGRNWILPPGAEELLPTNVKLMFSRHSSYEELRKFIKQFKPKLVYPCVESKLSWMNGFSVGRVFGDLCTNEPHEHRYDIERFRAFGNPDIEIRNRKVCAINRWSFTQCIEEAEFVEEYTRKGEVPFKGTLKLVTKDPVLNQEDRSVAYSWKRDFPLQGIIAGRGEERYKRLINYHREVKQNKFFDIRSDGYSSSYDSDSYFENASSTDRDSISDVSELEQQQPTTACSAKMINSSFLSIEKSFADLTRTNELREDGFVSPFINSSRIQHITNSLQADRTNWFEFKLQSLSRNKYHQK